MQGENHGVLELAPIRNQMWKIKNPDKWSYFIKLKDFHTYIYQIVVTKVYQCIHPATMRYSHYWLVVCYWSLVYVRCISVLKWKHFTNNKLFWLLNDNYASYKNQTICNEFGIYCHFIITQYYNFTNTVNKNQSLTPAIIRPWQPLWP